MRLAGNLLFRRTRTSGALTALLLGWMIVCTGRAASGAPAPDLHASGAASDTSSVWVERASLVMGTRLTLRLEAPTRPEGLRAADAALAAIRRYEDVLSSWRSDTDLGGLNEAAVGRTRALGSPLVSVLARAFRWSRATDGAFDPVVGSLVDAWALRGAGRVPSAHRLREALRASGADGFRFDFEAGTATRLHPAAWIDAGGFGKGVALEAARKALEARGVRDAFLDFGGQVLVMGDGPGRSSGWPVSVAHPEARHEPAEALVLDDASASTTGSSERGIEVGGRRFSHVLDPRSGRPAPDWGSVTVVASDPLAADAVSTALFVLGPEEGMAWARDRSDMGVLFLIQDEEGGLERRWNRAMETRLPKHRGPGAASGAARADDGESGRAGIDRGPKPAASESREHTR